MLSATTTTVSVTSWNSSQNAHSFVQQLVCSSIYTITPFSCHFFVSYTYYYVADAVLNIICLLFVYIRIIVITGLGHMGPRIIGVKYQNFSMISVKSRTAKCWLMYDLLFYIL